MIRINLLGVQRQKARKAATPFLDANQRTTFGCSLVVGITLLGISAWYWSLSREASRLDTEIASAQKEMGRLKVVLDEIKRAEERRAEMKERVNIIEELRTGKFSNIAERSGRAQDKDDGGGLESLRRGGYM